MEKAQLSGVIVETDEKTGLAKKFLDYFRVEILIINYGGSFSLGWYKT